MSHQSNLTITEASPALLEAIREINRRAFESEMESLLVDQLREGGFVIRSLVALLEDRPVGHILFSGLEIRTDSGSAFAAALAPMSVLPEFQNQGIGSALVREGITQCRSAGINALVVLGHPEYYPRFGFQPDLVRHLKAPFSGPAFMGMELVPGALRNLHGTVIYPPPFGLGG